MTNGAETFIITRTVVGKLQVAERTMERRTLRVSLHDRIPNTNIHRQAGVTGVIGKIATLKWNWAGQREQTKIVRLSEIWSVILEHRQ